MLGPAVVLLSAFVANLFCYSFLPVEGKNNHTSSYRSLFSKYTQHRDIEAMSYTEIYVHNFQTL